MKYPDYREHVTQGTFDFPISYYYVTKDHPRYEMPTHWHPEHEIIHILSGSFVLSLDGHSHVCSAGDIVFINDGQLHGGTPENCVYECFVFDMRLLLKDNHICAHQINSFVRHTDTISNFLPSDLGELNAALSDLSTALKEEYNGYQFVTVGALYRIIGLILRDSLYTHNAGGAEEGSQSLSRLKAVLNYIEQHYSEEISLTELADIANMNYKYFCRFFKEMTQHTPIDYVNYYRIECACNMLLEPGASITEIALNCGFSDTSYFIRTFRKYKETTPKQYIIQHGGTNS